MRIRTASVSTAAALALLVTGCAAEDPADTTDTAAPAAEASGGADAGGTGEDCVIEEPVPVGAALSLTGAAASYGQSQQKGLEVAWTTSRPRRASRTSWPSRTTRPTRSRGSRSSSSSSRASR
jgi:hypothetical protein